MNIMDKVSLILTTYNCEANIERTLHSIVQQDYQNIEIIVIDGLSTDNTLGIIRKYKNESSKKIVCKSERDAGIYEAMNKGYQLSTGDIIAFFNDRFLDNSAVSKFVKAINQSYKDKAGHIRQYDGVHSDLVYATDEKVIRYWHTGQGKICEGWMPGHPSLYLRRSVYEKYGLYNEQYKISADFEFMIRILKNDTIRLNYIPEVLITMYYGGTSTATVSSYSKSILESHRALVDNDIKFAWIVIIRRTIRTLFQFGNKTPNFNVKLLS